MKGSLIPIKKDLNEEIIDFLKKSLVEGYFDAVLIPSMVPAEDSYAYLLIKDKSFFSGVSPLPPIMPVQGGKVLDRLTRLGKGEMKIAALMRPCEISAAIELAKLKQVNLENITLISIDCPGVIPTPHYIKNKENSVNAFEEALNVWESDAVREVCKTCNRFSLGGSDIHIGLLGAEKKRIYLIPNSKKGKELLRFLEIGFKDDLTDWEKRVQKREKERLKKKEKVHKEFRAGVGGTDNFLETFKDCLNCHNCMRVCPICYCRQCYFDSEALELSSDNYLARAERKGSLKLPPDTLLFHLGRMSHMVSSCVSCGACEDACPVSIPVSQVFSLGAGDVQKLFNYMPGKSIEDTLPTVGYKKEELKEFEKEYTETYSEQEK